MRQCTSTSRTEVIDQGQWNSPRAARQEGHQHPDANRELRPAKTGATSQGRETTMRFKHWIRGGAALVALALSSIWAAPAQAQKPNIVVVMGDDIGIWNIGAYHRGMMAGRTPNIDRIANEGMLFTDYYAEASCTAGRAAFVTGELPIRTGMTTVGQAGAPTGL